MFDLSWVQENEKTIVATVGENKTYKVERIQFSPSWKAAVGFFNPYSESIVWTRIGFGSRHECITACEKHHSGLPEVKSVDESSTLAHSPTLSRRDYFAAMAMQGILHSDCPLNAGQCATVAVQYADALIEALGDGE